MCFEDERITSLRADSTRRIGTASPDVWLLEIDVQWRGRARGGDFGTRSSATIGVPG